MRNTRPSGPFSPELALSLVICPFPAILFAWGAPSIEGYSAFIQACDWLYIEAALTLFFMNEVKNAMMSAHGKSFFLYSNGIVSPSRTARTMFVHKVHVSP